MAPLGTSSYRIVLEHSIYYKRNGDIAVIMSKCKCTGILTLPGHIDKQKCKELLADKFERMVIVHEVGHTTEDFSGRIIEYPHTHIGFQSKSVYDKTKHHVFTELFGLDEEKGRMVWVSNHPTRDTVAHYLAKEDPLPIMVNWADTWLSDVTKGKSRLTGGLKKKMSEAAMAMDIPAMQELGMAPSQISRELQAVPVVEEEVKRQSYERHSMMDLTFRDNRSKREIVYNVDMDNKVVSLDRKGKITKFKGRRGIWIHGTTRCGKTFQARENLKKYGGYEIANPSDWVDYHGQQLLLFNEFTAKGRFADPTDFRCFIDAARQNRKYGSKETDPEDTFFIITCQYPIRQAYKNILKYDFDDYELTIEALENVFFELEFKSKYEEEGFVTYGTSKQTFSSDEEEDKPTKKAKTVSRYEMEEAWCRRAIERGDAEVLCEDGVFKRLLKVGDVLYVKTLQQNGDWTQDIVSWS